MGLEWSFLSPRELLQQSCSQISPPCQVLVSRCFFSTAQCHWSYSQVPPCFNLNQNNEQHLFCRKVASQCCVSVCGLLGFGGLLSQAVRNAARAVLALGFVFQPLRFLLGLVEAAESRSHAEAGCALMKSDTDPAESLSTSLNLILAAQGLQEDELPGVNSCPLGLEAALGLTPAALCSLLCSPAAPVCPPGPQRRCLSLI